MRFCCREPLTHDSSMALPGSSECSTCGQTDDGSCPRTGDGRHRGPAGQGSHQKTRLSSLSPCLHRQGSPSQTYSAGL